MQILKLGGSVLTSRGSYCVFIDEHLRRLAPEIKSQVGSLLLVHGMGSFGRAFLPIYDGGRIPASQASLARRIQQNLREFHELVVGPLVAAGVPVCSLDPEALFAVSDGSITFAGLDIIPHSLGQGRLPVLYGGTVWDEAGYFTILSSDQIVESVALRLGAERVVWATDVDGVFSRAPTGTVSVIRRLSDENLDEMWQQQSDEADCTGGMMNKVRVSLRLARHGIPSIVANAPVPDEVVRALGGHASSGTLIDAVAGGGA